MARSKYEIKAHKESEAQGYEVDYKSRPGRPMRNYKTDFFNRFDLLAHRGDAPLRMISIKGHAGVPRAHRKAIEDFHVSIGIQKEIWSYGANKRVRREVIE